MAKFYCEYCGYEASSTNSLAATSCSRHPLGPMQGRHKLYEGAEKAKYASKYCDRTASAINSLTSSACPRHPDGSNKGWHLPAL